MEFILILIVVIGALIIIGRLQDKKEQNNTAGTKVPDKVESTPAPIIHQSEPVADTVTVTVSDSVNTVSIVTPPETVKTEVQKSAAKKAPAKKAAKTTKEPTPAPVKKAAKAAVVKTESKVSTKRSSKKA